MTATFATAVADVCEQQPLRPACVGDFGATWWDCAAGWNDASGTHRFVRTSALETSRQWMLRSDFFLDTELLTIHRCRRGEL